MSGASDDLVDLRSDTVTRPDEAMRRAIAEAEVGDDVLGDDPTTRKLEEEVAALLGKERALFFPSGIMANQTALAVLCERGGEVVCEAGAHVLNYEAGAAAALSGIQLRPVETPDGQLTADRLRSAIRPDSRYVPDTSAVAIENTHLDSGGRIMRPEVAASLAAVARVNGLPVHLDGARLWHASVASGRPLRVWSDHATTVMVALSKGLGCPVGSILAGPSDVMERAWGVRRRFGGGMRQTGLLAAAALHALEHNVDRLTEDHEHAGALAAAFDEMDGFRAEEPETNIVLVTAERGDEQAAQVLSFLEKHRILMLKFGESRLRAVTHRDVTAPGIARTVACLRAFEGTG